MKNQVGNLIEIWRVHFIVALLVGLVVGTCIGVGEGVAVLQTQGLFGRYNELVAWAIAFDAPATIAVEFGLAIISGLIFSFIRLVPGRRQLVAMQLGETVFVIALATGLWSFYTAKSSLFPGNPVEALLLAGLAGIMLGGLVLAISMWVTDHAPFVRLLRVRYWLLLELVVVASAIAFGFSH